MVSYYFSSLSKEAQNTIVNELIAKNKGLQQFYDDLMSTEVLMSINTMAKDPCSISAKLWTLILQYDINNLWRRIIQMDINLFLNGDNNSLDVLKLYMLYFDNITVEDISYITFNIDSINKRIDIIGNHFINDNLFCQLEYLKSNNYITIKQNVENEENYPKNIFKTSSKIMYNKSKELFENVDFKKNIIQFNKKSKVISQEFNEVFNSLSERQIQRYLTYIDINSREICKSDIEFIKASYCSNFYIELLNSIFTHLISKNNVAINSNIINSLLLKNNKSSQIEIYKKNKFKIECASILLPDFSQLTFDDLFELKYKASDELIELHQYINMLSNNINYESFNEDIINVKNYIRKAVKNFELKIKNMKFSVSQKFLMDIPRSYFPLVGNFLFNIPEYFKLLISLGFITVDTKLEYNKQLNNIKKDHLYFLLKLNNHY